MNAQEPTQPGWQPVRVVKPAQFDSMRLLLCKMSVATFTYAYTFMPMELF